MNAATKKNIATNKQDGKIGHISNVLVCVVEKTKGRTES